MIFSGGFIYLKESNEKQLCSLNYDDIKKSYLAKLENEQELKNEYDKADREHRDKIIALEA